MEQTPNIYAFRNTEDIKNGVGLLDMQLLLSEMKDDLLAIVDYVQDDREWRDFRVWLQNDGAKWANEEQLKALESDDIDGVQEALEQIAEENRDVPHIWAVAHRLRRNLNRIEAVIAHLSHLLSYKGTSNEQIES